MILHGGDYSPEQWINDLSLIENDVKKFKKAGINCITMGMFSWSSLEPFEGEFNTKWLQDVLNILSKYEMKIIVGTPTASRPHWLGKAYPSTSRVNEHGMRELTGNRHNHCMSSMEFKKKAEIIIIEQLKVMLTYDNIHSIHINNEFSGFCYCDECINKFRNHLKAKYKTIENLNESWWTTFWSHTYNSFEDIDPPFSYGEKSNTPLNINWERFMTVLHNDYIEFEKEIIKRFAELPITTNFCGTPFTTKVNYYEMAKHLDYLSYDVYPQWRLEDNFEVAISAKKDLISQRCLDIEKDFIIMESSPGGTNWSDYTFLKSGKLHCASTFLQLLTGAKGCLYFQLKQSRASDEKFHGSVLNINSDTSDRVYNYVKDFGEKLLELDNYSKAVIEKEVAVFMSWECANELRHSSGPRNIGLINEKFYNNIFEFFNNVNINCAAVYDERDLELYDTIIIPFGYTISEQMVAKLKSISGKKIISFPMLNYVNEDDMLHLGDRPFNLTDEFGVNVTELTAIEDKKTQNDGKFNYELIAERVLATKAAVIESFNSEILECSVTKNIHNRNEFYYIAGIPTDKSLIELLEQIMNVQYRENYKVITNKFTMDDKQYCAYINFGDESLKVSNIVWSNGKSENALELYDCAIAKCEN